MHAAYVVAGQNVQDGGPNGITELFFDATVNLQVNILRIEWGDANHHITGLDPEEHRNNARLSHVMLFVMAIALHKLPEGMAAGVSVCSSEGATEWGVSFGIALQNIPEGMVIIAPLMMAGVTAVRTFFISIFIALLEVIGILLGFGLGSASSTFLPVMLGFAGGAMLYVTSDEMIPETHAHGFQKQATYALLLGFITFVLMEKCV